MLLTTKLHSSPCSLNFKTHSPQCVPFTDGVGFCFLIFSGILIFKASTLTRIEGEMGRGESGSRIEYIPELGLLGEIEFETQPSKDDSIFFKSIFFKRHGLMMLPRLA